MVQLTNELAQLLRKAPISNLLAFLEYNERERAELEAKIHEVRFGKTNTPTLNLMGIAAASAGGLKLQTFSGCWHEEETSNRKALNENLNGP